MDEGGVRIQAKEKLFDIYRGSVFHVCTFS